MNVPESNHTAEMGWLSLAAEILGCAVNDVIFGVASGFITPALTPGECEVPHSKASSRQDSFEAVKFLQGKAGAKLCEMLCTDSGYILRKCVEQAERKGSRRGPRKVAE